MSETVLILGAGASVCAGVPVMKDFLDRADKLRIDNHVPDAKDSFDLVFTALEELQQTHSKATLPFDNVESVFPAFEMARLIGRLGELRTEDVKRLPVAMRSLISRTVEETARFPVRGTKVHAPIAYDNLARYLGELYGRGLLSRISIITFNYDVCLDYAAQNLSINYCLDDSAGAPGLRILKLHGSLNWGYCPGCKKVVPWTIPNFFLGRHFADLGGVPEVRIKIGSELSKFRHCQNDAVIGPYVVPPTWNKAQYHEALEPVWRAAAKELSEARNIFVCGYSLPETDQFFRYLYALGTAGRALLRRFWVFNPDNNVRTRFEELLGQAAKERFVFHADGFDNAVTYMVSKLHEDSG